MNGWRGNTSIEKRVECDLYYAANWSLALDLRMGKSLRNIPAHHGGPTRPAGHSENDSHADQEGWHPPVLLGSAAKGDGIDELLAGLDRHWEWMVANGELGRRRRQRLAQRTREVVDRATRRWVWQESHAAEVIESRLDDVTAGELSPYALAAEIVATLKEGARL